MMKQVMTPPTCTAGRSRFVQCHCKGCEFRLLAAGRTRWLGIKAAFLFYSFVSSNRLWHTVDGRIPAITTWNVKNPVNDGINYLATGAGFPSISSMRYFEIVRNIEKVMFPSTGSLFQHQVLPAWRFHIEDENDAMFGGGPPYPTCELRWFHVFPQHQNRVVFSWVNLSACDIITGGHFS